MNKLARLEKVDLRDQWKDEAKDFTPWLAEPENIEIFSEAIGMDLEVIGKDNQCWVRIPNGTEKVYTAKMASRYAYGLHCWTTSRRIRIFCRKILEYKKLFFSFAV